VRSWIDHSGEVVWDPSLSLVAQLVEAGQPFWLDVEDPVIRRIVTPGRDLAAQMPLILSLPGTTSETQLDAEDISDQLQQAVAGLATIEERCSALLVLHASLASKHLAVVSRRLAAVATIFLPISFLAGFFGQNFNVLTGSIEKGWPAFLVLGVGLSVGCAAVTVFVLSRRGWN
jgi:magnesium transporter